MNIGSERELLRPNTPRLPRAGRASVARQSFAISEEFACQESSTYWTIDHFAFSELLGWLSPDPEAAGREYEFIRRKLITIFTSKRCVFPEELADETFNRVARKLPQIKSYYSGNPVKYFYGVAKRVYLEYLRRRSAQHLLPPPPVKGDLEELLEQLDYALSELERADRDLILNYYQGDGRSKINHRKALAKQMGLELNALRMRVYRIRCQLSSTLAKF